jgi:hypothetical protein
VTWHWAVELSRTDTDNTSSADIGIDRSTRELETSTSTPSTALDTAVETEESTAATVSMEKSSTPAPVAAAESTRPRRATGRVPKSARNPRPNRTADELLEEAREATADWSTADLTAEGIRKAVRTSAEKARGLRDTLRAERAKREAAA